MRIQVRELEGGRPAVHVAVDGDLDIKTAAELRELLASHTVRSYVVITLAELKTVDSTGLGVLIGGLKRARETDGDVVLAEVPRHVEKILDVTGLSRVFKVYPTLADALGVLAPPN